MQPRCLSSLLLCIAGLLVLGCQGGGSHGPTVPLPNAPEVPEADTPLGGDMRPEDRSTSNLMEGEVLVEPNGTAPGVQVVELPLAADRFAIVQLTAETASGGTDAAAALAYLAQPIGGFSVAPTGTRGSVYGVTRNQVVRTFTRHFTEDGTIRLELTNELEGGTTNEPVRWQYRVADAPDPATIATVQHADRVAVPLVLGTPHRDTLVRGVRDRGWAMRRDFSIQTVRDQTYRIEVRPLVSDPNWLWHISTAIGGSDPSALARLDQPATSPLHIDFTAQQTGSFWFRVWVTAPKSVSSLEAANFEVQVSEVALERPEVTLVRGQWLAYDSLVRQGRAKNWITRDGTPTGFEGGLAEMRVWGSGCPCTVTFDPPQREFPDDLNWFRPRFRLAEAGTHDLQITLHNAAGASDPFVFRYTSEPSLPLAYFDGPWDVSKNKLDLPLMQPVTLPLLAQYRATIKQIDYGPNAIPRYATSPTQPVFFTASGHQFIRITLSNDIGTLVSERSVRVGERPALQRDILQVPIVAGTPTRFAMARPEDGVNPSWNFWLDGSPNQSSGTDANVTFSQPGWHQGSLSDGEPGQIRARNFSFLVNPAGTTVLSGTPLVYYGDMDVLVRYQGGLLGAYRRDHDTVDFRQWKADGSHQLAPRSVGPFGHSPNQDGPLDLIIWNGSPICASILDDGSLKLHRIRDYTQVPVAIDVASAFPVSTSAPDMDWKYQSVSLAVRNGVLVVSAARMHLQSSLSQLIQATFDANDEVVDTVSVELRSQATGKNLQVVPASEGLMALVGYQGDAYLVRTAMTSDLQFGDVILGGATKVAEDRDYTYRFLSDGTRFYWLAGSMQSDPAIVPLLLTSTTWNNADQPANWQRWELPGRQDYGKLRNYQFAVAQSQVRVFAEFDGPDRLLELIPQPDGSFVERDRLDTIGPQRLANSPLKSNDVVLATGLQHPEASEEVLYYTVQ